MAEPPTIRIYRFGVYEADVRSGELRKNGAKLKLQEQPFQVLLMLLERPGEVVTREDLRQRLWPADTFVDFDHSLNTAINKLREALSDSANNPRFVETLARRGYRFIAPVQGEAKATELPLPVSPRPDEARVGQPPDVEPVSDLPRPARGGVRFLFALAQTMYLIFYIVALARLERVHEIASGARLGILVVALAAVTGVIGIPIRLYLFTAVGFDYRRLGDKFRRLFPFVFMLDELWALSPLLIAHKIGLGLALAACAALLYLPFSQRTLVRMGYSESSVGSRQSAA